MVNESTLVPSIPPDWGEQMLLGHGMFLLLAGSQELNSNNLLVMKLVSLSSPRNKWTMKGWSEKQQVGAWRIWKEHKIRSQVSVEWIQQLKGKYNWASSTISAGISFTAMRALCLFCFIYFLNYVALMFNWQKHSYVGGSQALQAFLKSADFLVNPDNLQEILPGSFCSWHHQKSSSSLFPPHCKGGICLELEMFIFCTCLGQLDLLSGRWLFILNPTKMGWIGGFSPSQSSK